MALRKKQLDSIEEAEHNESDESPDKQGGEVRTADLEQYYAARQGQQQQHQYEHFHDSLDVLIPGDIVNDAVSVGSNASSTIFSIPQYLTNTGVYSSGDDASVDSYSTNNDRSVGWATESPRSRTSSFGGGSAYQRYVTSAHLEKFEREQELLFQQKKEDMERELSNVLERNAAKSVGASLVCTVLP